MSKLAPFVLALAATGLAIGCTVTVKTQTKYVATAPSALTSMAPWVAQPIEIENANGSVTVVSASSATAVSVSAVPFAFADNETDGDAAVADVKSTLAIQETAPDATGAGGRIYVKCGLAVSAHGTAGNGTTGCDLTITIPAGSTTQGVPLSVTSHNGPVSVSTVTTAPSYSNKIWSDNGTVTATGITGTVQVHSENGGVTASLIPTVGSNVEASSGNGDVTLTLPASFAADHLTLTATSGKVNVTGFSDVTSTSTSRGAAGTGAAQITATTGLGDVDLSSQ